MGPSRCADVRPPNSRESAVNVTELLLRTAAADPERVALRWFGPGPQPSGDETWTYGALDAVSSRCAAQLEQLGVGAGDRVVVQVEKTPEAVVLGLAVFRLGAVLVPLNVAYREDEVVQFLEDAEPTLAVASPGTLESMAPAARRAGVPLRLVARPGAAMPLDVSSNDARPQLRIDQRERAAGPIEPPRDRADDDLAALLYTSGTTGRSKGAMLTHRNLSSNGRALCDLWRIDSEDVVLHALPIFHVHGLFVALHTALMQGAETLLCERFDPEEVVRLLPDSTVFMAVPTLYSRLLAHPGLDRGATRGMRLFTSGSAPLSPDAHAAFEERTGHRILERYGMTEAGMITSNPYLSASGARECVHGGPRVAGTVGFALPDVEVRICDRDGNEVAAGDVGVLEVRGPNVFAGYWRRPNATAEALHDGWLVSGDLATRSETGRVTLVGRAKDLILVGGYNVYPREVEDLLTALPSVAEAAVIGVPHPDMGEGVVACLVAAESHDQPDEPAVHSALQRISDFKRPRRIVWVEELPRNAMGKVQKNELRARYQDSYLPPP